MESELAQEAINAALNEDWKKAVKVNSSILKIDIENIDALNRLARAYAETGNTPKAKKVTKKVLKLDPTNIIASKCLERWNNFKINKKQTGPPKQLAKIFIEEPTKTRLISLINLGDMNNITSLDCGDTVKLVAHPHRVSILSLDDKYVGRLPDNLASKFINLIKLGGSFEVVIKSANKNDVKILIHNVSKNGL